MQTKKIAVLILIAAFGMRLLAIASFAEEKSLFYVNDSYTYIQVAKNILEHGVYSMEISETPHADNFRTPLYPLFLIPFVWLKTSFYIPAIIQTMIMSAGIAFFYLLGIKLWGERSARIGSILFALEPFGALISGQILTEAIFTPLFTISLLLLARYIQSKNVHELWWASALLGLSALARPIAFPLAIALPIAVFFGTMPKKIDYVKRLAASLGIFFIIVSPWLGFNWFVLKTASLSSVNGLQAYAYHGRYLDEWRAKRGALDRLPILDLNPINDTLNAAAIPQVQAVGEQYIKDHFAEYLQFHISRIPRLFTDSGYASILNGVPGLNFHYDSVKGGFTEEVSGFSGFIAEIKKEPLLAILFLADLFFIITAIFALINPFVRYRREKIIPRDALFMIIMIGIYAVISSPIGGARFRIPINPFLFILAIQSLLLFKLNRNEHAKRIAEPIQ